MRLVFPILLGLLGCAVLLTLGVWQVQRLQWKQGMLAAIDATIAAEPVPLPPAPDPVTDAWRPVTITGALGGEELLVLTSQPDLGGPGYRVISVLTAGDRRVLVDLGFVPQDQGDSPRMAERAIVTGNVHWPQEVDRFTPAPDGNLWFARDATTMAVILRAEPYLLVARNLTPNPGTIPLPIDSRAIPNDHLNYAITWFLLALVWAAMAGYLAWRTARRI